MEVARRKVAYRGTDFVWVFGLSVPDSSPAEFIDLTGLVFHMAVRLPDQENGDPLVEVVGTLIPHPVTDEANKAVRLHIDHDETAALPLGSLRYGVAVTDSDGLVTPIRGGEFHVYPFFGQLS